MASCDCICFNSNTNFRYQEIQQWTNDKKYYTTEGLIAEDPSAKLPNYQNLLKDTNGNAVHPRLSEHLGPGVTP